MRLELWMILITGAVIFHIYTDGKYTKNLMMYKKYFKMGGVVIAAFIFYVLLKKNPANAENIIKTSNINSEMNSLSSCMWTLIVNTAFFASSNVHHTADGWRFATF